MSEVQEINGVSVDYPPLLGELDWKVVDMARNDGPHSLKPYGIRASLLRKLFGITVPTGLANESLEALRRFCVRAWYWDLIRTGDMLALIDGGYSRVNAFEILAHVATHRGFAPSIQDDLLNIGSGLEGYLVPRPSGPAHALSAPRAPSLAARRGQSIRNQGSRGQARLIGVAR